MSKASRPRGSIKQIAPNKYRVRVYVGRDAASNKPSYHDETISGKKKDAQALLTRITSKLDQGQYVRPTQQTLAQTFDAWLKVHRSKVAPRTADWYGYNFDLHTRPALGNVLLLRLTSQQIEAFYASLTLGPTSIHAVHRGLAACLRWAVRHGLLIRNPAEGLTLPKIARKKRPALAPEQAVRLLKACEVIPGGLIVEFALLTGMRPEEYLGLAWSAVDLVKGNARVEQVLTRHKAVMKFAKPKTEASYRTIPLPPSLVTKLRLHRTKQLETKLALGAEWNDYNLVFCNPQGKPLHHNNIGCRLFKAVLAEAGLPDIRLYDLRHSQATLLLLEGESPKVVAERLGHTSAKLSLDIYSHVMPGMQERATEKLERLLYTGK